MTRESKIASAVTDDMVEEMDKFWENPQNILNLIDLIFLSGDPGKEIIPS